MRPSRPLASPRELCHAAALSHEITTRGLQGIPIIFRVRTTFESIEIFWPCCRGCRCCRREKTGRSSSQNAHRSRTRKESASLSTHTKIRSSLTKAMATGGTGQIRSPPPLLLTLMRRPRATHNRVWSRSDWPRLMFTQVFSTIIRCFGIGGKAKSRSRPARTRVLEEWLRKSFRLYRKSTCPTRAGGPKFQGPWSTPEMPVQLSQKSLSYTKTR